MVIYYLVGGIGDVLMSRNSILELLKYYDQDKILIVVRGEEQRKIVKEFNKELEVIIDNGSIASRLALFFKIRSLKSLVVAPMISSGFINYLYFYLSGSQCIIPKGMKKFQYLISSKKINYAEYEFGKEKIHQIKYLEICCRQASQLDRKFGMVNSFK